MKAINSPIKIFLKEKYTFLEHFSYNKVMGGEYWGLVGALKLGMIEIKL